MDHTAVGPALGYNYQFERATYRLLEAGSNVVAVGLEFVDDVSVHRIDKSVIREQDKATVDVRHPLTDRSVALWKTLSIWCAELIDGSLDLSRTEFHLVTNGAVPPQSLAGRIHRAKTPEQTTTVAQELLGMAGTLRDDLVPFGTIVSKLSIASLAEVIGQIFVLDSVSAGFGGSLEDLQILRLLSPLQRTAVFDNAAGWVRRTVLHAAQKNEPTVINRSDFDRQLKALFRRVAVAPLAIVFETGSSMVDPGNYTSHGFFQQLDWIETDDSFVRDCVIHYVQARAARVRWTDADEVSEESLRAYEQDLKTRWKLNTRRQALQSYPSEIARGQELLNNTLSEDTVLDGQAMPKAITCGSYHALADFNQDSAPEIGWHPNFEKFAKEAGKKS